MEQHSATSLTYKVATQPADDEGSIAHSPWSVHEVRNGLDGSTHRHDRHQRCRTWILGTYPCSVIRARVIRRSCTGQSEATVERHVEGVAIVGVVPIVCPVL